MARPKEKELVKNFGAYYSTVFLMISMLQARVFSSKFILSVQTWRSPCSLLSGQFSFSICDANVTAGGKLLGKVFLPRSKNFWYAHTRATCTLVSFSMMIQTSYQKACGAPVSRKQTSTFPSWALVRKVLALAQLILVQKSTFTRTPITKGTWQVHPCGPCSLQFSILQIHDRGSIGSNQIRSTWQVHLCGPCSLIL